jgi:hypothetical protein
MMAMMKQDLLPQEQAGLSWPASPAASPPHLAGSFTTAQLGPASGAIMHLQAAVVQDDHLASARHCGKAKAGGKKTACTSVTSTRVCVVTLGVCLVYQVIICYQLVQLDAAPDANADGYG